MSDAFVFAGQGAQYVGMGAELFEADAQARALLERADAILGEPLSEVILRGPEAALTLTRNTQPAVLLLGLVHAALARRAGVEPAVLLGHSLGEFGAWVEAGSLGLEDALLLVRLRGEAMQSATPLGLGAMDAVISADAAQMEALCEEIAAQSGQILQVAIYNCPGNLVISGHAEAVQQARARIEAEALGVVRPLAVSAPFHTSLLEPAARALEEALAQVELAPNRLPVIPNVTGQVAAPGTDPAQIRAWLVRQVSQPVLWEDSLRAALALGAGRAVLLGPGGMARGHLKRIQRRFPFLDMDKEADRQQLGGAT